MKSRNANYKLLKAFEVFESVPVELAEYTMGNIIYKFESFNFDSVQYETKYGINKQKAFHDLVSSPMLLARLVSAGFIPFIHGQNGYKITYIFVLRHKITGKFVTFYDYKGGSSYGSCEGALDCEATQKDLLEVLKALIDERFPHPYDGCVVGEVA